MATHKLAIAPDQIDRFDLALGNLAGLPDGFQTKPATIQVIVPVVGRAETFIIQTIRHEVGKKKPKTAHEDGEPIFGFTQFLQITSARGVTRVVIPPEVSDRLASQRESLVSRVRTRAARQAVQTRKDRGDVLGNPEALKAARRARKGGKR
jgi:hypothetical protein